MPSVAALADSALRRVAGLTPFPQPPLIRLRYPVVMMHGFGMLAALRWRQGHLHAEAMHLRAHGVVAYAPNVAPYNTISVRAEMWARLLDVVFEETGAERLNLIAHSMGGLDARHLIAHHGYGARVASLTTISTPHRGSAAADVVLEGPEALRAPAASVVDWIAATALEGSTSDVIQALRELRPSYVTGTFNPATPDDPAVRYASYAGHAGRGTGLPMNPGLRVLNALIYARQGPNDGMVAAESAPWGRLPRHARRRPR